ncbi:ligand-binding sensor domain-containing protein/AraC-like DNA-binding protein [Parabacteroides sp. PFB2-12]|nr:ligand-binding sensor domain-containing protein/AraC-like DNA-binding protein [Parabacteroides sp. PM6-13]MDH6391781.1 ligand-binding sensor domain-containing protein/AraC-like DNA-binding protein [Parabacteroides sp. PFB2-12]
MIVLYKQVLKVQYGMRNLLITAILLCVSWLSPAAYAVNYTFRGINMSDGLSDLLVNAIYKDSEGFIWLGTDNSLDRFDGVGIKHYPIGGTDLKKKRVNVILEGKEKQLWIGNNTGLWQLNSYLDLPERLFAETIDCPVYSLYYDEAGVWYVGTEKGLFIYEKDKLHHVPLHENIFSAANKVTGIQKGEAAVLWLTTADGLCKYSLESGDVSFYYSTFGLSGENIFQHITRIDHTLYMGTQNQGIFSFDITTSTFSRLPDVGSNIISALSSDGKENLYVGTDGYGVHFLSHKEKRVTRSFIHNAQDKSSIRSNSVYSLLVDREGIVWIGYYQAGFDYSMYQNGLFQVYAMPPAFDSKNLAVRSFYIDDQVKIIGTRDGLYYINETTGQTRLFRQPELRSNLILSITCYDDKYYIGTYGGGLSLIDRKTLRLEPFQISRDAIFRNGHIFCLKKDAQNVLWIGTSDGVYAYDSAQHEMRCFTHTNSQMPEGNTYDVFFDSTGKGWICTDNGLSMYDPSSNSMRSTVFPEGFFHKEKIRFAFEDSDKKLYFLPDRGRLLTSNLSMTIFGSLPIHPMLHGNAYTTIIQDKEGWFWLGSDDGLIRTRFEDSKYYLFNFTDGIPDPIFMHHPAYKDEKGVLWFSNNKGLLYVDPGQVDSLKRNPYPIVLTDVLIKGNPISSERLNRAKTENVLTLKEEENNVGFRFVNLSYSDPASILYNYKLDGVDQEWKVLTGENGVSYYDLKPGKYVFHIRIAGDEQTEVSFDLKIGSWLSSAWEWALGFVILLLIAFLLYQLYRSRRFIYEQILSRKNKEPEEDTLDPKADEKYKTNRLSEKECKELYKKLQNYMEEQKPYINSELKIGDLATAIEASSYSLSYLFNQHMNLSYYDYINQYRIEEFKRLVVDPKYKKYTLTALAGLCGFSSRSSFFRSFKKVVGITPNEYIQSLGLQNEE